jgi:drug/metabolite transporter (DMT)-like permease
MHVGRKQLVDQRQDGRHLGTCRPPRRGGAQRCSLAHDLGDGPQSAAERAILPYARKRWHLAALGGAASIGSYSIALWALTRAPVASVAALRETSVLFAAVLGTLVMVGEVMALRLA